MRPPRRCWMRMHELVATLNRRLGIIVIFFLGLGSAVVAVADGPELDDDGMLGLETRD